MRLAAQGSRHKCAWSGWVVSCRLQLRGLKWHQEADGIRSLSLGVKNIEADKSHKKACRIQVPEQGNKMMSSRQSTFKLARVV
jgi:hypothetical protein